MIDISPAHFKMVKHILNIHVPNYEVWAFGSRVTGTAKPYSDLDLVIITETPLPILDTAKLALDFSESDLPFKVDVLDWASLSKEFKKIIQNQYEVF